MSCPTRQASVWGNMVDDWVSPANTNKSMFSHAAHSNVLLNRIADYPTLSLPLPSTTVNDFIEYLRRPVLTVTLS